MPDIDEDAGGRGGSAGNGLFANRFLCVSFYLIWQVAGGVFL